MISAISVEIHAAIVGGLLSGGVVLLGVVLAENLRRRSNRKDQLVKALETVIMRLPVVLAYWGPMPPDPLRTNTGSTGWIYLQDVMFAINEIDALTRRRGRKNAMIRDELDDLGARIFAAKVRTSRCTVLSGSDMLEITARKLARLVFGARRPYDELFSKYLAGGFLPTDDDAEGVESVLARLRSRTQRARQRIGGRRGQQ